MKKIQAETIFEFQYLSSLAVSPNGIHTIYTVSVADKEKNAYRKSIVIDGEELKQELSCSFVAFVDDSSFYFTKEEEDAPKGVTRFFSYNIDTKEEQEAFTLPLAVTSMKLIRENLWLLTGIIDANSPDDYLLSDKEREAKMEELKAEADYQVVDEVPYYFNGKGFINKKRNALFLFDSKTQKVERITDPFFSTSNVKVEKEKVYFSGTCYKTTQPLTDELFCFDPDTKTTVSIDTKEKLSISDFFFLKGDLWLLATDQKEYGINETASFYRFENNGLKKVGKIDRSLYESCANDILLGGGKGSFVYEDTLYSILSDADHVAVVKIDEKLNCEELFRFPLVAFMERRGNEILFAAATENSLLELYSYNLEDKTVMQKTNLNRKLTEEYAISLPEEITYESNGMTLNGWVIKPVGYEEGRKYPAVLDIHGGPRAIYTPVFFHEMQLWAAEGYFVFFTNIHGSDGRGDAFADIRGRYGYEDFEDLMNFTDKVLEKYPMIDAENIFETGGSYGGFMTNWIVTHTDRFKAVASQRSISNWVGFSYLSDIGPYFALDQNKVTSFSREVETLWEHSPLKYVDNAKTPILFIHSDEDYRCPLEEGMQLMQALNVRGVETRMVIFHGENHELSRSGKPLHRIRRLNEITEWFNTHNSLKQ